MNDRVIKLFYVPFTLVKYYKVKGIYNVTKYKNECCFIHQSLNRIKIHHCFTKNEAAPLFFFFNIDNNLINLMFIEQQISILL